MDKSCAASITTPNVLADHLTGSIKSILNRFIIEHPKQNLIIIIFQFQSHFLLLGKGNDQSCLPAISLKIVFRVCFLKNTVPAQKYIVGNFFFHGMNNLKFIAMIWRTHPRTISFCIA